LLLINGAYLALVYYYLSSRATASASTTTSTKGVSAVSIAATCVLWVVQYLCYQSILDDAALNRTGSATTSSSSSSPLAGGVALDLLAFMIVIQFAGVAWSPKAYWGLLVLPVVVVWQFYKTIRASLPSSRMTSGATAATAAPAQESTKPARRGNKNTKQR
jgi:SRP-independent targeting protein 2/TMEM208